MDTLQEIEDIKLQIYNDTKHMTPDEFFSYIREEAVQAAEKYGFTIEGLISEQVTH